jgi:glycogen synthase
MRVLMVSWEYPPLVYGGLGRHVHGLSEALAADGHDIAVLSQSVPGAPTDAWVNGVRVVRASAGTPTDDFAAWVAALNHAQDERAAHLLAEWVPEVVHAHDWLSADAGIALAERSGCPLVATVHATEAGLWNGWLTTPLSRTRHDAEAWLVRAATRTIVCSAAMRTEVSTGLQIPADELTEVHNAVDPALWVSTADQRAAIRARLDVPPEAPLVVLAGRIEWEKGGDVAIRALSRIRRDHPGTQLVLAGTGSQRPILAELAREQRVARSVHFTGHLAESELAALLGTADVALVPSSYEPFGMVALEASAAGTPVIAGAAGGLPEIIADGVTGLLVQPRSPGDLADAVVRILRDPAFGAGLVRAAQRDINNRFVWPVTARATEKVYAEAAGGAPPHAPPPPRT